MNLTSLIGKVQDGEISSLSITWRESCQANLLHVFTRPAYKIPTYVRRVGWLAGTRVHCHGYQAMSFRRSGVHFLGLLYSIRVIVGSLLLNFATHNLPQA